MEPLHQPSTAQTKMESLMLHRQGKLSLLSDLPGNQERGKNNNQIPKQVVCVAHSPCVEEAPSALTLKRFKRFKRFETTNPFLVSRFCFCQLSPKSTVLLQILRGMFQGLLCVDPRT